MAAALTALSGGSVWGGGLGAGGVRGPTTGGLCSHMLMSRSELPSDWFTEDRC